MCPSSLLFIDVGVCMHHYDHTEYVCVWRHVRVCFSMAVCISGGVSLCVGGWSIVCIFQASSLVGWLNLSPGEGRWVLAREGNSVALTAVRSHQGTPGLRSITPRLSKARLTLQDLY